MTTALSLSNLSRHYGKLKAVEDVTFDVATGHRHAVIGPNGAGKSTLFGLIAGTVKTPNGRVSLGGRDVSRLPEHGRARLGIVKTFQNSSLFSLASSLDNVVIAVQRRAGQTWHRLPGSAKDRATNAEARFWLAQVGLDAMAAVPTGGLSHGERRQLEVAVALATRPKVLLLDEPTAGMSVAEGGRFIELIQSLGREITVLFIEHDLDVVFRLADWVTVLHLGQVLAEGPPEEIRESPKVQTAYLGTADLTELFLSEEGTK